MIGQKITFVRKNKSRIETAVASGAASRIQKKAPKKVTLTFDTEEEPVDEVVEQPVQAAATTFGRRRKSKSKNIKKRTVTLDEGE